MQTSMDKDFLLLPFAAGSQTDVMMTRKSGTPIAAGRSKAHSRSCPHGRICLTCINRVDCPKRHNRVDVGQ